jgi:hypothetical protein
MRYSIAAASLFSTSVLAVLYPGQSNVNHTCQLSEWLEPMRRQSALANAILPQPTPTPSCPALVPPTRTPSTRVAPKHTEACSSLPSSGLHTLAWRPRVNCFLPMTGHSMDCGQTSATVPTPSTVISRGSMIDNRHPTPPTLCPTVPSSRHTRVPAS